MEGISEATEFGKSCGDENNISNKESNLEIKIKEPCTADTGDAVDEDAVLGGDETTKDIDGNIDEDELLKDTETDEVRKNVEYDDSEMVSNSESPAINSDSVDASVLDNNQNVNSSVNFVEGEDSNSASVNISVPNEKSVDPMKLASKLEDGDVNSSVHLNYDNSSTPERTANDIATERRSDLSVNDIKNTLTDSSDLEKGAQKETPESISTHFNSNDSESMTDKMNMITEDKGDTVAGKNREITEDNEVDEIGKTKKVDIITNDTIEDNVAEITENKSECTGTEKNNHISKDIIEDSSTNLSTGTSVEEEVDNTTNAVVASKNDSPSHNTESEPMNEESEDKIESDTEKVTERKNTDVTETEEFVGVSENALENTVKTPENKNEDNTANKSITPEDNALAETKKMSENKPENTEESEGTKFVHVEQENSRPDESMDVTENSVEDPFAQTSDEVMDTSEVQEKETDLDNSQTSQNNEPMDVQDASSNIAVESDVENPTAGKQVESSDKSIEKCEDLNVVISVISDKSNKEVAPKQLPEAITIDDDDEDSDLATKDRSSKDTHIMQTSTVNSNKSRPARACKSKGKSKVSLSDESTDEDEYLEDLEMGTKSGNRPKRSAAKKAESQIKVLTAVERQAEQDEVEGVGVSDDLVQATEEDPDIVLDPDILRACHFCKKIRKCVMNIVKSNKKVYFCGEACFSKYKDKEVMEIVAPTSCVQEVRPDPPAPTPPSVDRSTFVRKCSQCSAHVREGDDKSLSWETMEYCSDECLGKYQQELGSHCANCKGNVQPASLGKYCVRFGYEVKQFCCSSCLEEFKKGLKVCSFCQKDISSGVEGFLAPVGDKGTFKDFCTQACMEKYEHMSSNQPPPAQTHACHVCNTTKLVEVEVLFDAKVNKLCSILCFNAYKFANNLEVDQCDMCKKYFDKEAEGEKFNIFYEGEPHNFCCKTCLNVYILAKRKIVPCNWCKVKKYNFDMIKRVQSSGHVLMMCSLNCLTLYNVSVNAVSSRRIKCDMCKEVTQAQYHLTMSDATMRNFCTYPCVMNFQQQYGKSPITLPGPEGTPVPTGAPKRIITKANAGSPIIASVASLANGQPSPISTTAPSLPSKAGSGKNGLVMRMMEPPQCRNKNTQTRAIMNTKSVSCRPHTASVEVQTEDGGKPVLIPVPVPIYVPCPMAMYSLPFPVPVPFPVPIPVPVFLPTTRNSIKGIMQEIKRIQEKVPDDPYEAELLMMAEMVAEDKKQEGTSSESEADNDNEPAPADSGPNSEAEGDYNSEAIETNNAFGEDIVEMAFKMATELDEPASDLETHLAPATILNEQTDEKNNEEKTKKASSGERSRKRQRQKSPQKRADSSERKKRKPSIHSEDSSSQPMPPVEDSKPDANMKLKYTFGVNAWKSWVTQKNAEIEVLNLTATKKLKPFKNDILLLTTDELNFSLCLFVKEVKKPNGAQYAPDTIYYLCLGIQQYLFENNRIDNIFTDSYYETFTDALDEVAKKFSELFNDHHYIVTRVEEEHLWESKQLGAHSPHVLLSTLMFFNTKHFNLISVDEHLLLSFSHIMKHWKRVNAASSTNKPPANRNVLLRFYPPQALLDDPTLKKKKVYEQHENEENNLRCPVKLYEFYLSKCPESVRSRNDVFYLQPERSCVPDSPVWYSTMALGREPLQKMLNRVKMIKEINIALLTP